MKNRYGEPGQLYRIWLVYCPDWRPTHWNDVPPRGVAAEPAVDCCLASHHARAYVKAFNRQTLKEPTGMWAVPIPVVIRYDGDLSLGQRWRRRHGSNSRHAPVV